MNQSALQRTSERVSSFLGLHDDEIVVGEEVTVEISLTLARRKGLAE